MKFISVVTACFNEEENVGDVYQQVKAVFAELKDYTYEHIFIDNASKDKTVEILTELAKADPNLKVIVNTRNFGHIRSPFHALLQARGDAVISIAADLQEPPAMIVDLLKKWEEGYKVVLGIKTQSEESPLMFALRKAYYEFITKLAEVELIKNSTGFGLYDQRVIELFREINDPYPYFRGLVSELGFECAMVEFTQPARKRGVTKNNFYTLYDMAMLGLTNHTKIPLRLAAMLGFAMAAVSLLIAIIYFLAKIMFWNSFSMGIAPMVCGIFFFASVQLLFIGIIGEYVGSIYTQVRKRPLVVEKKRINF